MAREIYADHAGTTPPAREVVAAMTRMLEPDAFGNPSSVHGRGEAAREALEVARSQVAALIGAKPEEVVFTATGSEANNLAIKGALEVAPAERRRLIVSAIEHPAVLETARDLESRGVPVTYLPVSANGIVAPGRVAEALGPDVALVSIMWVNNEVGSIQPVRTIATLAHEAGARVHCDAIQAIGKLAVGVEEIGVDFLSLAGHKFHGPLGAAALYVRRRARIAPLVHGGHQERSRRAGTENLPAIVGLGAAAERARMQLAAKAPEQVGRLGERLREGLTAAVPGTQLNGDPVQRVRSIVNLTFEGVDGEAVLHELDREGITVSTGSACSAAGPGPSHVLLAMGRRPEAAHASVRFSLGDGITESDVDRMIAVVPVVVQRLRALGGSASAQAANG